MKKNFFGEHAFEGSFYEIKNGEDALINPDKYFKASDHVQVSKGLYRHAAIYIGNKMVIQVSDPNGGHSKKDAVVNEAHWRDFHGDDTKYYIYFTHFKHRRDDEIINVAQKMICNLKGKYNFLLKNCQHFATFCQFGCDT